MQIYNNLITKKYQITKLRPMYIYKRSQICFKNAKLLLSYLLHLPTSCVVLITHCVETIESIA